jgi:hypothetical protein
MSSRTKIAVAILTVLATIYAVSIGWRAVALIADGRPVAVVLGLGIIVLPVLAGWGIVRELAFGMASERLGRQLADEGGLPPDDLPRRPSGRFVRSAADEAFVGFRQAAEVSPSDWRVWFRLGLAYDACGDRRRARTAIRRAIALAQSTSS